MKTQAPGVQFIAVGGRKQTGPMQAVGGSKGSNDQELSIVANVTLTAYQRGDEKERALFAPYVQGGLEEAATQAVSSRPSSKGISNHASCRATAPTGPVRQCKLDQQPP